MRFEKVSREQYLKDCKDDVMYDSSHLLSLEDVKSGKVVVSDMITLRESSDDQIYDNIRLPARGTKKSAGYDIFAPYDFTLSPGETIKLATGIRVLLDDDKFLLCAPRSGHGFKSRIQLDNTVGIIDADYSDSTNEGHIMLKLTNDSHRGTRISVKRGDGMAQAIILSYSTTEDDVASRQRDGGFGSTDIKEDTNNE